MKLTEKLLFMGLIMLPFLLEITILRLLDQGVYLEAAEIGCLVIFIICSFTLVSILFRSFKKTVIITLSLFVFFIILLEMEYLMDKIMRNDLPFRLIILWILSLLTALATALFVFFLMKILSDRKSRIVKTLITLLVILAILNFSILIPDKAQKRTDQRPNIIFVVMDTLRADHMSLYGYERLTSPGIDWLAKDALVYEKAMSPAPWTPSGHASLFTGLLPAVHGTDGDYNTFNPPGSTLAEVLQKAGYKTAAIVNNPMLAPNFGWNRGFDIFKTTWTKPQLSFSRITWIIKSRHEDWPWFGSTKRTLFSARRWWASNGKHQRFLFLNLIDPHSPYGENHKFKDYFLKQETRNASDISNDSEDYDAGLSIAEGPALKRIIARYDGDIRYMDFCLESFFRWLSRREEIDHTLIILTSDHGERLGERGLLGHQLGLDHVLLHVPLIVRYPPSIPARRHSHLVQTHGIYATVLKHLGLEKEENNLKKMAALEDQNLKISVAQMRHQGKYIKSLKERNPDFDKSSFIGDWNSVSDGNWKLHLSNRGDIRLYNLIEDPDEETNILNEFSLEAKRLIPFALNLPKFIGGEKTEKIPKKLLRLLESLGYVNK